MHKTLVNAGDATMQAQEIISGQAKTNLASLFVGCSTFIYVVLHPPFRYLLLQPVSCCCPFLLVDRPVYLSQDTNKVFFAHYK